MLYVGGERHRLNRIGAQILSLCDGTRPIAAVMDAVATRHDAPEASVRRDAAAFCDELERRDILASVDAPAARRWSAWHAQAAPRSVTVEITQRCNMRCVHCYNASGDDAPGTLRLDEIIGLLRELAALGTASVSFAGGEPLMRTDLDEMIAAAAQLGMHAGIASNGFALTPSRIDRLVAHGLGTVQVSLDYPDERHDEFRKRAGALAHAEAAIRTAVQRGVRTIVSSTVTRDNASDVGRIKQRAHELGATHHLVNRFIPVWRGAALDADMSDDEFHARIERLRDPMPPMIGCDPAVSGALHCAVGSGHLTIAHDGDVKPCVSFQAVAGNIRDRPLAEIWRDSPLLVELREQQFASLFEGKSPGCPSHAFATSGPTGKHRRFARVVP